MAKTGKRSLVSIRGSHFGPSSNPTKLRSQLSYSVRMRTSGQSSYNATFSAYDIFKNKKEDCVKVVLKP
jgi:hypothetical protein